MDKNLYSWNYEIQLTETSNPLKNKKVIKIELE